MNSVGTGKVFLGKSILEITKENYKDRNINFRKFSKGLMLGMLAHSNYKTLNLSREKYEIVLKLSIVPIKEGLIIDPVEEQKKKIEAAKKKIDATAEKLIKVVK